jgi:hypothetical protein
VSALQNISARNPAIIARRKIILLRIVMYALEINLFLLFILLFSSFLYLHFPHNLLFWVLLPIFFLDSRKPHPPESALCGPGEQVKPRLFQALTRGAIPDSNSRPAVQISSPLPSRYTLWGLFFQYYSQASSINDYFCLFYSWFLR